MIYIDKNHSCMYCIRPGHYHESEVGLGHISVRGEYGLCGDIAFCLQLKLTERAALFSIQAHRTLVTFLSKFHYGSPQSDEPGG